MALLLAREVDVAELAAAEGLANVKVGEVPLLFSGGRVRPGGCVRGVHIAADEGCCVAADGAAGAVVGRAMRDMIAAAVAFDAAALDGVSFSLFPIKELEDIIAEVSLLVKRTDAMQCCCNGETFEFNQRS